MDGGRDQGKVFLGGISVDTTEDKLVEYFVKFGEVDEVVIMKDRETGKSRGFGFVIFSDPAVAEKVIGEKHTVDNRQFEAKKSIPASAKANPRIAEAGSSRQMKKIFVGGLAPSVTEEDFKTYFEQFGPITDAVVMFDLNTRRHRGFGFITFGSAESVENVLSKQFHELKDKMVEVKRAVPRDMLPPQPPGGRGGFQRFDGGYGRGEGRFPYQPYSQIPDSYGSGYGRSPYGSYYEGYGYQDRFGSVAAAGYGISTRYGGSGSYSSSHGMGQGHYGSTDWERGEEGIDREVGPGGRQASGYGSYRGGANEGYLSYGGYGGGSFDEAGWGVSGGSPGGEWGEYGGGEGGNYGGYGGGYSHKGGPSLRLRAAYQGYQGSRDRGQQQ